MLHDIKCIILALKPSTKVFNKELNCIEAGVS